MHGYVVAALVGFVMMSASLRLRRGSLDHSFGNRCIFVPRQHRSRLRTDGQTPTSQVVSITRPRTALAAATALWIVDISPKLRHVLDTERPEGRGVGDESAC
jgi:hypothetical protein